jgi:RNA-directed DNA polymerase
MASRQGTQLLLALEVESELGMYNLSTENPTAEVQQMEQIVAPSNLRRALQRVQRNKGGPGVDGMAVDELPAYLRERWPKLREQLLVGKYRPSSVRACELPKPGGGTRTLGIPTVLDRFIQQAVLQVLQPEWDPTFSESSFGFRPKRSAHQAIARVQEHYREGRRWVVDLDLEKFFDRVNHDKLMWLVEQRTKDWRVSRLIRRYLKAGMQRGEIYTPRGEGTPQGGPLSPLLANLLLDQLDKELEQRGHRFARYADDCNIYVRSRRAAYRIKRSITRYLSEELKLKVNEAKSEVAKPRRCSFLGFSIGQKASVHISAKTIERLKMKVRELTSRNRGRNIGQIIRELSEYLDGWLQYYRIARTRTAFFGLQAWMCRRLRCYMWKQWGRAGYRKLRARGVSQDLAWNTCKSGHGPWRLSHSPALSIALPTRTFAEMGLTLLYGN